MTKYAVEVTKSALIAISKQARFIALEQQAPISAQHWLEQVWDAVDSLEDWPFRAARAAEDCYVPYEVRQLVVGSQLLLFTILEEHTVVRIIGLRHAHRRPRPEDLPLQGS